MNKTVSINLGGLFFHIDEDAYQKLNRYFDAIKRSLSPDGKDEIMNDIEGRIAELLAEKLKNDKQVVSIREVDEVIAVMGQPEDYRIDDEETKKGTNTTYFAPGYVPPTKKFYRDGDRGLIAGVAAGIAHYFRIDPLWIRIIFIISPFISFGSSILIYVLLWILIPKAITTTEKLEMTGEPINISNIEKKVREEINTISEKFKNVDYDKFGANAGRVGERIGNTIGDIFLTIFNAIAKVVGAFIVVFTALAMAGMLCMLIFVLFSSGMPDVAWYPYMNILNYTDTPLWILGLLGFFAIGIPVLFLFLLGLKILVNNLKPMGSVTAYTFLAIWIISVASIIYFGMRQATEVSTESKTVSKEYLNITVNDTLKVKFRNNDYFSKSTDYNTEFRFTQDAAGNDVIYSNMVRFYIMKTDDRPYVQIEKLASGVSLSDARKRAEKIKYNFEIQGNNLILDNYLLTDVQSKYRNQKVEIYLYLPEGIIFRPDSSVKNYDDTDNSFFDLYWDSDKYTYRMEDSSVKCLDCPEDHEAEGNRDGWRYPNNDRDNVEHVEGHIDISDKDVDMQIKIKGDSTTVRTTRRTN
jgi:phage shock protein PspC (stress-responsive transcriptional regulator)